MRTTRALQTLLIAGLLAAASAHAAGNAIRVAMEDGKRVAELKVGDSNCELVEGRIRCTFK